MLTRCAYSVYLSKTKHAFVPPKPKELDITRLTWMVRVRVRVRVGVRFGGWVEARDGVGVGVGVGVDLALVALGQDVHALGLVHLVGVRVRARLGLE